MSSRPSSRQSGFSLLEVLIALLILSLGLIGLAGLMVVSIRTNHTAFLRSQATFLADDIAERMRANIAGVWNSDYNSDAYPVTISSPPTCASGATCNYDDLAKKDQAEWSNMLTQLLPAAEASVDCEIKSGVNLANIKVGLRPPYNGLCTVRISWSEQGVAAGAAESKQTFSWVFQP